jgi:2-oxo-4-hydroxy-4-carboxy-5-ureidoimidazoline decarboxylase
MPEPHQRLNALSEAEAKQKLFACCSSTRWTAHMLALRPFASTSALYTAAERTWAEVTPHDHLEAFAHHPAIGADISALAEKFRATATLSGNEQSGVAGANPAVLNALAEGNLAYQERFGFVFLVCATGKSAEEMLALLRARIGHSLETEHRIAADEQAKITRLRLENLK